MSEPSKKKIFLVCLIIGCIPALASIIFLWVSYYMPPEDKFLFAMMATFIGNIPWGFLASDMLDHFLSKFSEPPVSGVQISFGAARELTIIYLVNWILNAILVFVLTFALSPPKKKTK